ncbi:hypothetical protein TNCV_285271 [Trichonephila clavipes]|nr:hypothetical protein TNCV_285271 [Trichonephila clavipes]
MRSTKNQLVKKDVLMPVKQCFPVEPSGCRRDSPLVSMEVSVRSNGRYGMQPKKQGSLRAQAQLKTRTETCELVEEKQKLLDIRERRKKARGARAGVTFCISSSNLSVKNYLYN